jgi:hypothetical protein
VVEDPGLPVGEHAYISTGVLFRPLGYVTTELLDCGVEHAACGDLPLDLDDSSASFYVNPPPPTDGRLEENLKVSIHEIQRGSGEEQ